MFVGLGFRWVRVGGGWGGACCDTRARLQLMLGIYTFMGVTWVHCTTCPNRRALGYRYKGGEIAAGEQGCIYEGEILHITQYSYML